MRSGGTGDPRRAQVAMRHASIIRLRGLMRGLYPGGMVMRRQLGSGKRGGPDSAGNTGKGYEKSENPAAYHQATRMM